MRQAVEKKTKQREREGERVSGFGVYGVQRFRASRNASLHMQAGPLKASNLNPITQKAQ